MIYASRKVRFCAAHRYFDPALSEEENIRLFGKCAGVHGHNYELEVTVRGEVDERTGMVVNLAELDRTIRERVLNVLDHKNLQEDVEEFGRVMPTTEMMAKFIWKRLEGALIGADLHRVRLYEDPDLFVDYYGD